MQYAMTTQDNTSITYDTEANHFMRMTDGGTSTHFYRPYEYIHDNYFQYYPTWIDKEDKVGKAFKMAGKLIEKGYIKIEKVDEFIKLINDLSEIL